MSRSDEGLVRVGVRVRKVRFRLGPALKTGNQRSNQIPELYNKFGFHHHHTNWTRWT